VRLRIPDEGATVVRDIIRGESSFENALLDDLVIARADGTPVYHLAVVVDDLDAGITHVVRGADHYSNTPKQLRILQALGAPSRRTPMSRCCTGPDGKKLSKRHGAASVQELRDAGYLPRRAQLPALLGWGYDDSTTFFATDELKEKFTLERVSRNPAIFDEQKLRHINGRYLRELDLDDLTSRLEVLTGRPGLRGAAAISQEKMSTLTEFWPLSGSSSTAGRRSEGAREDPRGRTRTAGARRGARGARGPRGALDPRTRRTDAGGGAASRRLQAAGGLSAPSSRLAGTTVSPGIFETVALMGREEGCGASTRRSRGRSGRLTT
jgi:glutamyl-tRNA synthetase